MLLPEPSTHGPLCHPGLKGPRLGRVSFDWFLFGLLLLLAHRKSQQAYLRAPGRSNNKWYNWSIQSSQIHVKTCVIFPHCFPLQFIVCVAFHCISVSVIVAQRQLSVWTAYHCVSSGVMFSVLPNAFQCTDGITLFVHYCLVCSSRHVRMLSLCRSKVQ